jgi:hypothetical protein
VFGERLAKAKVNDPDGPEMIFFYSFEPSSISSRIRQLCKLPDVKKATSPTLVLLDIPDNGGFYAQNDADVSEAGVGAFIASFKAKTLERKQLGR